MKFMFQILKMIKHIILVEIDNQPFIGNLGKGLKQRKVVNNLLQQLLSMKWIML